MTWWKGCRLLRAARGPLSAGRRVCDRIQGAVIASWLRDSVPTVAAVRGWTAQDAKVRCYEWLDRRSLRRHDAMTVVSKTLRDGVIREGAAPERVFWVPNAIDPDRLPPRRQKRRPLPGDRSGPGEPIVGAVGPFEPGEGPPRPARRVRPLRTQRPGRSASCSSATAPRSQLSASRRRPRRVRPASPSWDCADRRPADHGCAGRHGLPSFSEGMPNVVLEAFAYGTPVVATAVGGVPDLMADARAGWLVPAGDPAQLAAALAEALINRAGRRAPSSSGARCPGGELHRREAGPGLAASRERGDRCEAAPRAEAPGLR